LRELRFIPTLRNTTLIAPDKSVPQTRHCADRLAPADGLMRGWINSLVSMII
jgi:hypothetical protein